MDVLECPIKGDKFIKIIANNPNNPKLQHSPYITNNQITRGVKWVGLDGH